MWKYLVNLYIFDFYVTQNSVLFSILYNNFEFVIYGLLYVSICSFIESWSSIPLIQLHGRCCCWGIITRIMFSSIHSDTMKKEMGLKWRGKRRKEKRNERQNRERCREGRGRKGIREEEDQVMDILSLSQRNNKEN